MSDPPYRTYARYLRDRYGCSVYRVAVDAGFTCPNRCDGGRQSAGCTYCAEDGARAPYLGAASENATSATGSLARQVEESTAFLRRRYDARAFILYFQAHSNTNAPVAKLRRVYDEGLSLAPFVGMNVATRPDCIDAAVADLLAAYQTATREVWVELGLQSAHDTTLDRIRRGHTVADFLAAYILLKERGLKVAVHLIFGLPGEHKADIDGTVDMVGSLRPDGVKIHNLHVARDTLLAAEYSHGEVTAPCAERHLGYLIDALERLPPETVIMRLTCDTPPARLLAPRGFGRKEPFLARLASEMQRRGARQGRLAH